MVSVKEHYDNLLATYYSWMSGGFDLKIEEYRTFFRNHGIRPVGLGVAVDLGAGSGFQSIPLAEAGFRVIALDTNRQLLATLKKRASNLPIEAIRDNLLNFTGHSPDEIEVAVCMGDTLTRLQSLEQVQQLLERTYSALTAEGRLILSFRDLTPELAELDRFIPVRSDTQRIFTCFLEYEPQHVVVHDIVYEMNDDQWQMNKSAFRKLRISPQWVNDLLVMIGYEITTIESHQGIVTVIARKPT